MKNISKIGLGLALVLGISACGANNNQSAETPEPEKAETQTEVASETDPLADKDVIKLGVVGENNEVWEDVVKRYEEGSGKSIEIVSFSEYREPNEALLSGDIDINASNTKNS